MHIVDKTVDNILFGCETFIYVDLSIKLVHI